MYGERRRGEGVNRGRGEVPLSLRRAPSRRSLALLSPYDFFPLFNMAFAYMQDRATQRCDSSGV
nr:MAG TPA: hypothetical protein [Caudoviricetes sp.]